MCLRTCCSGLLVPSVWGPQDPNPSCWMDVAFWGLEQQWWFWSESQLQWCHSWSWFVVSLSLNGFMVVVIGWSFQLLWRRSVLLQMVKAEGWKVDLNKLWRLHCGNFFMFRSLSLIPWKLLQLQEVKTKPRSDRNRHKTFLNCLHHKPQTSTGTVCLSHTYWFCSVQVYLTKWTQMVPSSPPQVLVQTPAYCGPAGTSGKEMFVLSSSSSVQSHTPSDLMLISYCN